MKKFLAVGLVAIAVMSLAGCDSSDQERVYTEQVKQQSLDVVGMPAITNFFEMQQLKNLYELRDDPNLICYWYTKNNMTGKWVYEGKCIGYGIPYGASITSPERYAASGGSLPLAEPNGLYNNGVTTSATWILSVDGSGEIKPIYTEQEICVSMEKIDKNKVESWSLSADY